MIFFTLSAIIMTNFSVTNWMASAETDEWHKEKKINGYIWNIRMTRGEKTKCHKVKQKNYFRWNRRKVWGETNYCSTRWNRRMKPRITDERKQMKKMKGARRNRRMKSVETYKINDIYCKRRITPGEIDE